MGEHWQDSSLTNESIRLDGNRYTGCTFENCTLTYAGGPLPIIESCETVDCTWQFTGAAERTVQFMALLYKSGEGGRRLIDYTFEHIMRGHYTAD